MNRNEALKILKEYTKSESLLKHAYAVEAAMRAYAEKYEEDVDHWGITGLLHDFDYEMFPENHPYKGNQILKEKKVDEDILTAIMGHATFSGVARDSLMAKSLFAVDELCGFITAVTLVRPTKALSEVKVKSVKKKMKDKRFAAKVNREEMLQGAEELGVDFDEHVMFVVNALSGIAAELDLNP
ncbi:MAG: HD domain-containing protein [Calditrichaeota bacterium]|nr:MAG: HD domain-containing protein [Calditrichota bacterium]MBL1205875.1 HD domain-containing protein [Calditrichota bacterium]NOG45703.1 HD domain-containing protein [Calditrichota bacterium]